MSTALSKRHQARNERALQELIRTVPGNDRCADCQSKNPGWASWSLGIFLCMRCASIHRKLGTHVSKVKSLSMDSWTSEQVDNMKRIGNVDSNRTYNPKNIQPPIPFDGDEVDTAMEKFIRQKYVTRTLSSNPTSVPAARHDTGTSYESDELPPPPPPKGRRFGFGLRSASSALALPLSKTEVTPTLSPEGPRRISQTPGRFRINKQSRVFGATIGVIEEGNEWKLTTLREMGFPDGDRNANVLRGLNGDLEKAIESLARLGEGASYAPKAKSPTTSAWPTDPLKEPRQSEKISRSVTMPVAAAQTFDPFDESPKPQPFQSRQTTGNSNNPFDRPAQPQPQQSYNPFDIPSQVPIQSQQQPLEQAFQNMHVSPPLLFPNSTGGHPQQQQELHQARLQQSMTPPVPQLPPQYQNPWAHNTNATYNTYSNQQQQSTSTNPYQTAFQTPVSMNPFFAEQSANSNPYTQQHQSLQQQSHQQIPQQWTPQARDQHQQQSYFNLPTPQSAFPGAVITPTQQNPFPQQAQLFQGTFQPQQQLQQEQLNQSQPYHPFPHQQQAQFQPTPPQPLVPQRTGRFDNQTILNLYNYPQLAPPPLPTPSVTNDTQVHPPMPPAPHPLTQANRSVTMPVTLPSGSKNPFLTKGAPGVIAYGAAMNSTGTGPLGREIGGVGHASQESMESSGRHSPDAFASLSARTAW